MGFQSKTKTDMCQNSKQDSCAKADKLWGGYWKLRPSCGLHYHSCDAGLAAHNDWEIQQMEGHGIYGEMTEKSTVAPLWVNVPHGHTSLLKDSTAPNKEQKLESQHSCYARQADENAALSM